MEIRELTAAGRVPAIALWERAGLTVPWNSPSDDFDRALAGPTSTVLGAFDGDALVATAMAGHDGHRGWIYYVAVETERRSSGAGRRIMAAAEDWLRERGAVKVNLMVRTSNADAVGFYERLGYEDAEVRTLGRWLGDRRDDHPAIRAQ
jgi:ribosomal protein S18 acetylase RimI-like enzyme